jgi:hypothetical protein
MKILTLSLGLLMLSSFQKPTSSGISDESEAIKALVLNLFDAMRESDGEKAAALFQPGARMLTALKNAEGATRLAETPVSGFVEAVGKAKDEVWDERITHWEIKIDGPMAMAWTHYDFYRGDAFSHCGVNVFTLFHNGSDWKIVQIIDTRNTEGCK